MAVLAVRSVLIIIHSLRLGEVAVAIKEVVVLPSPPQLPSPTRRVFGLRSRFGACIREPSENRSRACVPYRDGVKHPE